MAYNCLGQTLKIKRTDGRVHPAVVAKINDACNSLMDEWCERGETIGKVVDLDAIPRLNPEIVSSRADLLEQQQHSAPELRKLATQLTASAVTISSNIGRYHTTQSGGALAGHRTNRIAISVSSSGG